MSAIKPELRLLRAVEDDGTEIWSTHCFIEQSLDKEGWCSRDIELDFGTMAPTEELARTSFFRLLNQLREALDQIQDLPAPEDIA